MSRHLVFVLSSIMLAVAAGVLIAMFVFWEGDVWLVGGAFPFYGACIVTCLALIVYSGMLMLLAWPTRTRRAREANRGPPLSA